MQFGKIVAHETAQQSHQFANFTCWTRPVFRAERKNGEDLDSDLTRGAHGPPKRLHAAAVAFGARQSACRRPTPIAIHDDSNMARHIECRCIRMNFSLGHATRPQTVRISFSFPASM